MIMLKLIACHLLGDYFLQTDYLAREKCDSFYCLLIHCFLYCVPFYLVFQSDIPFLIVLFISHVFIDGLKIEKQINAKTDQVLHYIVLIVLQILYFIFY